MKFMKKNLLLIATLIVSMTLSPYIQAKDYNPDPGDEDVISVSFPPVPPLVKNEIDIVATISPMKKGQVAPFTGLLLSPAAISSIIVDIESKNETIQTEIQKAVEIINVQHTYETTVERIRNESNNKLSLNRVQEQRKEIDRLDAALKKEKEDRPNPATWAVIGICGGIIITTLAASVVIYATKQ